MSIIRKYPSSAVALWLLMSTLSAASLTVAVPAPSKLLEELHSKVLVDLPHPFLASNKTVVAQLSVTDSGQVILPRIFQSSGDLSIDFAVLEAVCSLAPLPGLPAELTSGFEPATIEVRIDAKRAPLVNSEFRKLSCEQPYVYACHRIPLSVLYRYPGLFSDKELRSISNLRILETQEPDAQQAFRSSQTLLFEHYKQWCGFFNNKKVVTREDLIEFSRPL